MQHPDLLAPGSRVALVCPSGPLRDRADLDRALDNARSFGFHPVPGAWVMAREGYWAGTDAQRLHDLNTALRDDSIDAVWCIRGGYGAMRLLDGLDYEALRSRPRAIIGYSDITALHCAVQRRCELVSFHGPTARAAITDFSRDSFRRALIDGADSAGPAQDAHVLHGGRASGRLVGGNLALLAALAGTPYAPDYDGAIVVLEDVNEPTYRIERMLLTLRLGGSFLRCKGIVFGAFTHAAEQHEDDGRRTLPDVLREVADALRVPCIAGVPLGHIDDQWTLPLGADAELDADNARLTVSDQRR
jgi:muramoyltetrapeptide carboxypeptidase